MHADTRLGSQTTCNVSLTSTTQPSADVPIHDEKAAMDTNHNNVIRDAPRSYAALGPSEFNDNIV